MEWLRDILIAWFSIDSGTASIIAASFFGLAFTAICVCIGLAIWEIGKGGGNILSGGGNFVSSAGTMGETLAEGVATSGKTLAEGGKNLLSTPYQYIKSAEAVRLEEIKAAKQSGRAYTKDKFGNEAGVELSGNGSLEMMPHVVDSMSGLTSKVIPPSYVRLISDRSNGEVE